MTLPVVIHPKALAAHGLTTRDLVAAYPGTVIIVPDGTALRVTEEGALDPVIQGSLPGMRSIGSDPSASRRLHDDGGG